jgi:hypothetical protein
VPFGPPISDPKPQVAATFGAPTSPQTSDPNPTSTQFGAPLPLVPAMDLARRLKRAASDLDFTDPDRASALYAHAKRIEEGEDIMVQDVPV